MNEIHVLTELRRQLFVTHEILHADLLYDAGFRETARRVDLAKGYAAGFTAAAGGRKTVDVQFGIIVGGVVLYCSSVIVSLLLTFFLFGNGNQK